MALKRSRYGGTSEKPCEDPTTGNAQHVGPGLASAPLTKDMSSATVGGTGSSARYVSYVVKVDSCLSANHTPFCISEVCVLGRRKKLLESAQHRSEADSHG